MSVPTGWYKPVGINKEDREFHDTPDLRGAKENGSNPGLIKRFPPPSAKLNRQLKIGTYWVRTRIQFAKEKRYADASHRFDAGTRGRRRAGAEPWHAGDAAGAVSGADCPAGKRPGNARCPASESDGAECAATGYAEHTVLSVGHGDAQIFPESRYIFLGGNGENKRRDPRSSDLLHDGWLDADCGLDPIHGSDYDWFDGLAASHCHIAGWRPQQSCHCCISAE